jgi:hypothetical protein
MGGFFIVKGTFSRENDFSELSTYVGDWHEEQAGDIRRLQNPQNLILHNWRTNLGKHQI